MGKRGIRRDRENVSDGDYRGKLHHARIKVREKERGRENG
jgi:hypothetical protein